MVPRLITARELRGKKINTHRLAAGYDIDETDDILDRAADTLDHYEHGGTPGAAVQPVMEGRPAGEGRRFDIRGAELDGGTLWLTFSLLGSPESHKTGQNLTPQDARTARDILDAYIRQHEREAGK